MAFARMRKWHLLLTVLLVGSTQVEAVRLFPVPDIGPSYRYLEFVDTRSVFGPGPLQFHPWGWSVPVEVDEMDEIALVDLDLDGIDEVMWVPPDPDGYSCGTAGCDPEFFKLVEGRWTGINVPQVPPLVGFIAVRDEVVEGFRTLYSWPAWADGYLQAYTTVFPKGNRGPDERVEFVPKQGARPGAFEALLDLDGDGAANWRFDAYSRPQGGYSIGLWERKADGEWDSARLEDLITDGYVAQADERDGLPAMYLRDESFGHPDDAVRTFYSSPNGPRLRVPFTP